MAIVLIAFALPVAAKAQPAEPATAEPHGRPARSGPAEAVESLLKPAGAPAAVTEEIEPATLTYWNRDIVVFRAKVGFADPEQRAQAAATRLGAMSERLLAGEVTHRLGEIGGVDLALVTVSDQIVIGLVAADVPPLSEQTLEELAAGTARSLRQALAARREQRRWRVVLEGLAAAFVATGALVLLLVGGHRLHRRLQGRLAASRRLREGVRFLELDLGTHLLRLLSALVIGAVRLLAVAAVYLWLIFVLSRFSYSEPWGDALGGWLAGTLARFARAIVGALPGLATVALIVVVARAVTRLVAGGLKRIEEGALVISWLPSEVAKGTRRIVVMVICVFTVAIAYPFIPGSSSGAFQGVSVLAGLMVSLASAGLVNHVLAGWVILFSRGVRVGDYVRIGEVEGRVLQLGVLSARIVTRRREVLTLPNAVVTSNTLTNYSQNTAAGACLASTAVTIGYDAPWRQVQALLLAAAERTPGVRPAPPPQVLQRELSDFYVEYELVVEVDLEGRPRVLSALHGNIQDAFNEHGVQIMSPHYEGQPEREVVVPRARWFASPAQRDDAGGAENVQPTHDEEGEP